MNRRDLGWLALYLVLWISCLFVLRGRSPESIGELISAFLIVGVCFSVVAYIVTLSYEPLDTYTHDSGQEVLVLFGWFVALVLYFTFLHGIIDGLNDGKVSLGWLALGIKLLLFVAIPSVVFVLLYNYTLGELMPAAWSWNKLQPALWLGLVMLAFQAAFGSGVSQIQKSHISVPLLIVYAVLAFLWLAIEAGFVEEFFFRALLQERLSLWLKSDFGAIVIASVLFGLLHAPGFYLRSKQSGEAVGEHPSLLVAIAYSVVATSAAGVFFGVVWARTRNLAVVVLIHAATDLLPNLPRFFGFL